MIQQAINGLMIGSSYALVAIGYTLVFGVLRLLNLAHPEIFMAAGFIALAIASTGIPMIAAAVLAVIGCGLLGIGLYYAAFRPLRHQDLLAGFITSLAFGLILRTIIVEKYGATVRPFPELSRAGDIQIAGVTLAVVDVAVLLTALALMMGLTVAINRTASGRRIRAVASNPTAANLLGVPLRQVYVVAFFLSSLFAGMAGVLSAVRYEGISPFVGLEIGLKALAVMVIGGLGDIRGAFVAGISLGIVEALLQTTAGSGWADGLVWAVLIVTLLVKPAGLFGRVGFEREV